jgi:ferredoxin
MAYIITRLCVDCKDTACADVCPVECIYEFTGDNKDWANQLYINPDECIDCTNCEPACPWSAIFEEDEVPDLFSADTEINYKMAENSGDFVVATVVKGAAPTEGQVGANFKKYSYEP